jgi:hypothetical protein
MSTTAACVVAAAFQGPEDIDTHPQTLPDSAGSDFELLS